MSLTSAFSTARNSLLNTATQLSTSAKNIENASNTSYSRKNANLVSGDAGNTSVVVARAGDAALFLKMLDATSNSSKYAALLTGLTTLQSTIGDTETDTSVAARLSTFQTALSSYANAPDNDTLGQAAITAAENLATALNSSTRTVQSVRAEADANIANSVSKVNDLLSQFKIANDAVIAGTVKGDDISDALDARDSVLSKLSEEMGVTTVLGQNNDMKLYTDGGATLFDQSPRSVTFVPSATFDGTTVGNAVYVDGVAVTGASSVMPLKSGAIAGYAEMRDVTTVTYQDQLDEVARGLISAFQETDQSGGGGPAKSGLFTNGIDTTVAGGLTRNLAATITVNAAAVVSKGGSVSTLRDGGMNGAAYAYNTTNAASFGTRLAALQTAIKAQQTFSSTTQLTSGVSLQTFASSSVSWLEGLRTSTTNKSETQKTLLSQASTAVSNASGVNTDQEYATQLQLEKSYQASSKILSAVQSMYDALFSAIR